MYNFINEYAEYKKRMFKNLISYGIKPEKCKGNIEYIDRIVNLFFTDILSVDECIKTIMEVKP